MSDAEPPDERAGDSAPPASPRPQEDGENQFGVRAGFPASRGEAA
jgi:hypothetical protein